MAKNPIITPNILSLGYAVDGLTHHIRFYVSAVPSGDSTGYDLEGPTGNRGMSDCIDDWVNVVNPLLASGTAAAGYTLYENATTGLIPIVSGSYTLTPSGAGAYQKASEMTVFLRDTLNRAFKSILLESIASGPFHGTTNTSGALGTALHNYVTSFLVATPTNIGFWSQSRSDLDTPRFRAVTISLNKRVRRRRGLV